jgi:hypothetical protein
MSFDIHILRFVDGDPDQLPAEPLREVFRRHGIHEHSSPQYPRLHDGLSIDLWSEGLDTPEGTDSVTISVRAISPALFYLLYDLIQVPGVSLVIADTPLLALVSNQGDAGQLPADPEEWAPAVLCTSPEEVTRAVLPAFQQWESWAYGDNEADN